METFCRVHEPRQPVPSGKPEHCAVSLTSFIAREVAEKGASFDADSGSQSGVTSICRAANSTL